MSEFAGFIICTGICRRMNAYAGEWRWLPERIVLPNQTQNLWGSRPGLSTENIVGHGQSFDETWLEGTYKF